MAGGVQTKGGKKNRKFGHNATRSISQARYRAEMRWLRNKKRAIEREAKRQDLYAEARAIFPERRDLTRAVRQIKRGEYVQEAA